MLTRTVQFTCSTACSTRVGAHGSGFLRAPVGARLQVRAAPAQAAVGLRFEPSQFIIISSIIFLFVNGKPGKVKSH